MSEVPYDAGVITYLLRSLKKMVEELQQWQSGVDKEMAARGEREKNLAEEVHLLRGEVNAIRKLLIGVMVSVTGSAIVFAFTVLTAVGKI